MPYLPRLRRSLIFPLYLSRVRYLRFALPVHPRVYFLGERELAAALFVQ